jgi:AraC-like DNA-binding protein
MKLKLPPNHDFSDEVKQSMDQSLPVEPVMLERFHIFRRYEPERSPPHQSSIHQEFVLWLCLSGQGCLMVDGITYLFRENNAMLVFPSQAHMRISYYGQEAEWLLIRFHAVVPHWFDVFRNRMMNLSGESEDHLQNVCASYFKAIEQDTVNSGIACACHISLLLDSLRRSEPVEAGIFHLASGGGQDYVRQICRLLMTQQSYGMTFEQMARRLGVSPSYLRAVFRQSVNVTPAEIIRTNRVHLIQHLLLHSTLNITQIADQCRFSSVYAMSRFFRQRCGISPLQYRKRHHL